MHRHEPEALIAFLREVDTHLRRPVTTVVIGGAALALNYGGRHATLDIDVYEQVSREFLDACAKVNASAGRPVPVEIAAVADAPYDYDERLEPVALGLKQLTVLVPERHDLAIMKSLRANEHDLQALSELHHLYPLSLDTLVERFWEARHATGESTRLKTCFLATVARLFGDEAAAEAEVRIERWPHP